LEDIGRSLFIQPSRCVNSTLGCIYRARALRFHGNARFETPPNRVSGTSDNANWRNK
jgi:hypothetical protein